MPIWISDFLSSPAVIAMTNGQVGSYLLLLMAQWSSADDRIPERHVRQLARWRGPIEQLREVLALFRHEGGFYFNAKLRKIRSEDEEYHSSRSDKASRAASARWTPEACSEHAPSIAQAMPSLGSGRGSGSDSGADQEVGKPVPAPRRAEDVPIPVELDTPEFRVAWFERWLPWRRSKDHGKGRPVSVGAAREQLAKLAPCGPGQACIAIAASISNDWQGLFPDRLLSTSGTVKARFGGSNVDPATQALLDAERRGGAA